MIKIYRSVIDRLCNDNVFAYPTVTSKMLLPTELDTAISPNPFRATMTLVMRSGILVPAARNVRPITSGGIRTVSPTTFAHQTIRYEYPAIHTIDPMNVTAKNFFPEIEIKSSRLQCYYYKLFSNIHQKLNL